MSGTQRPPVPVVYVRVLRWPCSSAPHRGLLRHVPCIQHEAGACNTGHGNTFAALVLCELHVYCSSNQKRMQAPPVTDHAVVLPSVEIVALPATLLSASMDVCAPSSLVSAFCVELPLLILPPVVCPFTDVFAALLCVSYSSSSTSSSSATLQTLSSNGRMRAHRCKWYQTCSA
jgi:hypothetical protein